MDNHFGAIADTPYKPYAGYVPPTSVFVPPTNNKLTSVTTNLLKQLPKSISPVTTVEPKISTVTPVTPKISSVAPAFTEENVKKIWDDVRTSTPTPTNVVVPTTKFDGSIIFIVILSIALIYMIFK